MSSPASSGRRGFGRHAHVAFLDESGFMLMPLVRRTLARRGQRVFIRCSASHDRVSAISCITLSPRAMRAGLYFQYLVNENYHGEEEVEFLAYLTGKVPGPWTVVWDRNNIHSRSRVVKAWLARHPQVAVEDFPAHDPSSNPDEWVWSWAKYGKLCNLCPADVDHLCDDVWDALEELKRQPALLTSFIVAAGVPLCL
jgi:hypothetical protein